MNHEDIEAVILLVQVVALAVIGGAVKVMLARIARNGAKIDKLDGGGE